MTMNLLNHKMWVIVPTYNEERTIRATLQALRAVCPDVSVLVIDDGSTDQTHAQILGTSVYYYRHSKNRGQGAALLTGIQIAERHGARAIVTFDADGQHDPNDINKISEPIINGRAKIALGSRFKDHTSARQIPFLRRIILKAGVIATRWTFGIPFTDVHNGLRCIEIKTAVGLNLEQPRMAHATEILWKIKQQGLDFVEVPVTIHYSPYSIRKGQSNWAAIGHLRDLLRTRFLDFRAISSPSHPDHWNEVKSHEAHLQMV